MTKGPVFSTIATKLDALQMKKYYSNFIKQNCKKDIEWLLVHAMAPLDHLFDNHHLCNGSWCHKKKAAESDTPLPIVNAEDKRNKKTHYRSMVDEAELYKAMKEKYAKYISKEYLQHCQHSFDTQINEGINNSVSSYASKRKHYS